MKKVLIVEDEKMLREMYVQKFSRKGIEIISAAGAEEGLKLVKQEKPSLVLLDIILPRENGLYFLEKLREKALNG